LHRNFLIKRITEGKIEGNIEGLEDEEGEVSSYCMTLGKREDTGG
jgi:hypothetical protein